MKAKLIKEATEFRRGQGPKKSLDVGIERSDNPNNLANAKSLYNSKTNQDVLESMMEELNELHRAMHFDLNPREFDVPPKNEHLETDELKRKIYDIENAFIALENFLKLIKR